MKLSIVIPCYNTENYIGAALDSILHQEFEDLEIICIDDGSEDRTLDILKNYQQRYEVISVYTDTNHGQGYQRNIGMDLAKGAYLYFMDSDDLLTEGSLARMYECASGQNLDLLYFEGKSFYETPELELAFPQYQTLYHRRQEYPGVWIGEDLYMTFEASGQFIVNPCLQLARLDFLRENQIRFPCLPAFEDNLYTLRSILAASRAACIPDVLFRRRIRNNSTMTVDVNHKSQARFEAYRTVLMESMEILCHYQGNKDMEKALCSRIIRFGSNLARDYDHLSDEQKAALFQDNPSDSLRFLYLAQHCMATGDRRHREECKNLSTIIRKDEEKLNHLQKDADDAKKKSGALKTENEALKTKLETSSQEKKDLKDSLRQTLREKSELEASNKRLTNELQKLNSHFLVRMDQKLRSLYRKIRDLFRTIF